MWPTLVALGPVTISSFGVMAVVAFFMGAFLVWRQGREAHFDENQMFDGVLIITFWGLIGARLTYGLEHWTRFWPPTGSLVALFTFRGEPGLSVYGGLVLGLVALWWWAKRANWDVWELADVVTPGLILALALGWVGAWASGSGYGAVTDWPWGMALAVIPGKRHPVQLIMVVILLIGLWLTLKWEREYRTYEWYKGLRSEARPGFVAVAGILGLSLSGWVVGWLQPAEVVWGWWSVAQWQWLAMGGIAIAGLYHRSGRSISQDLAAIKFKLKAVRIRGPRMIATKKSSIKIGSDVQWKRHG